jgi:hypothetical protein
MIVFGVRPEIPSVWQQNLAISDISAIVTKVGAELVLGSRMRPPLRASKQTNFYNR